MSDLAQKYRPRRFVEVAGQAECITWLRRQVATGEARAVLMSGPIGTGKTTLGLIYAKALFCEASSDGEPCGACENCRKFGERGLDLPDFVPFECGERSTVEEVKQLLDVASLAPLCTKRRVVLLDEVHNLSRRAFDALLRIVETPPPWTTFIFLTSKPEAFPPALVSRLTHHQLKLLSASESAKFLAATCDAEGISHTPEGLMLLYAVIGGHPRSMLRGVEKVLGYGGITAPNVRNAFELDFLDRLIDFSRALLGKDFSRQHALVEDWPDVPRRKLEFLHRFFAFNYFAGVRRLVRADPLMNGLPAEFQKELLDGMAQRATRLKLQPEDLWESAIAVLEPREALNEYQLGMIMADLDRRLNPREGIASLPTVVAPRPSTASRLRATRSRAERSGAHQGGLAWSDVEPTWTAATFLPQQYGVLINVRLTVHHHALGLQNHQDGAKLVSCLTHQLGMRLSEWRPNAETQFHWLYRHEVDADGAMSTRLALHISEEHLELALRWLRVRFFARYGDWQGGVLIATSSGRSPSRALSFHWSTVRALSRGLDVDLRAHSENGELKPLTQLLGIPRRWRGDVGKPRCGQSRGESKSLRVPARKAAAAGRMAFLSAVNDKAWSSLDSGWELDEFRDRLNELNRRREENERLRGLFPGDDALSEARLAEELARHEERCPADPKQRLRSWIGWWAFNRSQVATLPKTARTAGRRGPQAENLIFSDTSRKSNSG